MNDWGGVSPVTPDHVNPEAAWPDLDDLARETRAAGRELVERLAIVPAYARSAGRWVDAGLRARIERLRDTHGHARSDDWYAGSLVSPPAAAAHWFGGTGRPSDAIAGALAAIRDGAGLERSRDRGALPRPRRRPGGGARRLPTSFAARRSATA